MTLLNVDSCIYLPSLSEEKRPHVIFLGINIIYANIKIIKRSYVSFKKEKKIFSKKRNENN